MQFLQRKDKYISDNSGCTRTNRYGISSLEKQKNKDTLNLQYVITFVFLHNSINRD